MRQSRNILHQVVQPRSIKINELTDSVACGREQERMKKSKLEALINTEKVKQAERAMRKKGRRKEALCGIDKAICLKR